MSPFWDTCPPEWTTRRTRKDKIPSVTARVLRGGLSRRWNISARAVFACGISHIPSERRITISRQISCRQHEDYDISLAVNGHLSVR